MKMLSHFRILTPLLFLSSAGFAQTQNLDTTSFVFPLNIGDAWFYNVSNDNYPGIPINYKATIRVESDTLMPNGKKYYQLPLMYSGWPGKQFLRKDGLQVYQYFPLDSNEHLRFDFSAKIGDTISVFKFDPFNGLPLENTRYIALSKIDTSRYLYMNLKTYHFIIGVVSGMSVLPSYVADSLGIVFQQDSHLDRWILIGAIVNGKKYGTILAADDQHHIAPNYFYLYQNYPNRFNPSTKISFDLPHSGQIHLFVYDCLGREVSTLINDYRTVGHYDVNFNANELSSGMYFYTISFGSSSSIKKMLLLR